jgi:hypothetical protein
LIVRAVGLAAGRFLLLLLDVVDFLAEDLLPVFEEFLAEDVAFDLAVGFFVVAAGVAGFVDWAAAPPGAIIASREPTTTANRTFDQLPTLALTS